MELNELQIDAITEVINIGVGRAAASLSELINDRIELSVPHLDIFSLEELSSRFETTEESIDTSVVQDFTGGISGRALLGFPKASGIALAQVLGGQVEATDDLDFELIGILEEVGNIVLNGVLGTISNLIGNFTTDGLEYSVPRLHADKNLVTVAADHIEQSAQADRSVVLADTRFDIGEGRIVGSLAIVFDIGCIETICEMLLAKPASSY